MARSPGFGPASGYFTRPVQTRFRFGFAFSCLTLHPKAARRFILQKARHHPLTGSDFLQAYGFRFSFTPLARFFSPFPHGTSSLSLTLTYLALADGPACFRQDFSCPVVLRIPLSTRSACQYRDFTFCVRAFHHVPVGCPFKICGPSTPYFYGLGSFPFARRYSGNHCCFLFLRLLRCFSWPGCSPEIRSWMTGYDSSRVAPFGYLRVNAFLTARRSFSQSDASFFIQEWQGILRTPFLA